MISTMEEKPLGGRLRRAQVRDAPKGA